jgi:riboflavin kinase/FMN adenylyltransferase
MQVYDSAGDLAGIARRLMQGRPTTAGGKLRKWLATAPEAPMPWRPMQTYADLRDAQLTGPVAVTIGNFDGLHLGHQALLAHLRALAGDLAATQGPSAASALVTFSPHPLAVLRPERTHLLLTTPRERLLLAASGGIDIGAIHPFTHETARTTAREFCELLTHHLGMAALLVGPDFALGRNRSGDIPTLRALGEELGFASMYSTRSRWASIPCAAAWCARCCWPATWSRRRRCSAAPIAPQGSSAAAISAGARWASPRPTSSRRRTNCCQGDGVYATRARLATFDRVYNLPSVTNIGVRPTVDGLHRRMETHILDFPPPGQLDDLYGETVAVDFVARLRGEQRFPSLEALVQQIHADIAQARAIFAPESE